jgi:iron-sulfur cluster insertion protein
MITVTDNAKQRIVDLLIDENNPTTFIRIYVEGGGCSGMQYGFMFDTELNEDDFVVEIDHFKLSVDSISMQYLEGAKVDYKEDLMESRFVIDNPNATTHCGCGSSFGI